MGLLFIGSAVADVQLDAPYFPRSGEEVPLTGQRVSLGGCACNAYFAARQQGAGCELFAPVGRGVWGDFVAGELARHSVEPMLPRQEMENGCCYCLVEPDGERTFLCVHGAEYRFESRWFDRLDLTSYEGVYVCGMELTGPDGDVITAALAAEPPRLLLFAPGPWVTEIPPERMAAVLALHPVVHLNHAELARFTGCEDPAEGAKRLQELTGAPVVVTCGADGAWAADGDGCAHVPGEPVARVVNTIGAGDSHAGALLALLAGGVPLQSAVRAANEAAARVVGSKESHPEEEQP